MVVLMAVLLTSNKLSVMVKEKFETNNHLSYIHNTYDIYLSYAYNIYIYIYIERERERETRTDIATRTLTRIISLNPV